jgi:hypothetical protein
LALILDPLGRQASLPHGQAGSASAWNSAVVKGVAHLDILALGPRPRPRPENLGMSTYRLVVVHCVQGGLDFVAGDVVIVVP